MGAWIETLIQGVSSFGAGVAPYVGAWIETITKTLPLFTSLVAPYVGAWIETHSCKGLVKGTESHPTWVRGLKHVE